MVRLPRGVAPVRPAPPFGVAAAGNLGSVAGVVRVLPPLLALALVLSAGAQSAAPSLPGLVANSPFGAPAATGSPAAATPLEFRGTFVDGGERFFSILDAASRRAEWVGLNEPGRTFTVKAYDAEQESVSVEFQGRLLELKLHPARIGIAAAPTATANPSPGAPVAASPLPSTSEAQRLAQVAEEIRRRRALRQQAQQAQTPAPSPARN